MTKVYLLLRENHQSGPYSIDELKQQHLLPTDLVWVEGQSHAWRYPSEIEGIGKSPGTSPERSVRSGGAVRPAAPMDEIEERAEELRKRAMSYTHSYTRCQQPVAVDDEGSGAVYLPREREVEIVYHKKPRSGPSYSASQLIAAGLITAILAAGWYGRDSLFQHKTQTVSATVSPFVPVQNPGSAPAKAAVATPEQTAMAVVPLTPQQNTTVTARKMKAVNQSSSTPEDPQLAMAAPVNTEPEVTTPQKEEEKKPEIIKETTSSAPAEAEPKKEPAAEPENKTEAKEEKKKTLGQAIKGIFKKKKKDKEEEE